MTYPSTPLARVQPSTDNPEDTKRDGWQRLGILVVSAEDTRLDWIQREFVKQIGEKLYGIQQRG